MSDFVLFLGVGISDGFVTEQGFVNEEISCVDYSASRIC